MKSEIRRPKPERNPNTEIRTRLVARERRAVPSDFGLLGIRISFGLRPSGFGFLFHLGFQGSSRITHHVSRLTPPSPTFVPCPSPHAAGAPWPRTDRNGC